MDDIDKGSWVTRDELFQMVWSTPMVKLAEKFSISDVALAKKCKKLGIPRPGPGYWARIAAGQKPKVPVLPPIQRGQPAQVFIHCVPKTVIEFSQAIDEEIRTLESGPPIEVANDFRKAHSIIRQSRKPFEKQRDQYGSIIHASNEERLYVGTSKALQRRAMLILDALFKALEQHSFEIRVIKDKATLSRSDVTMDLSISERYKRFEYTEEERKEKYGDRYYYEPSGVLYLVLQRRWYGNRTWKDLSDTPIERRLTSIVTEIVESYELNRLKIDEWNHELQRQAEVRRLAEEKRARSAEERRRLRELLRISRSRDRIARLRTFLERYQGDFSSNNDSVAEDTIEARFLRWGYKQVNRLEEANRGRLEKLAGLIEDIGSES